MRYALLLLIVGLAGCATADKSPPRPSISTITPKAKARVATKNWVETYAPPTHHTFRWTNCAPQKVGTWYLVYERLSVTDSWHLYAQVTNGMQITIPLTNAMGFYTVAATNDLGLTFSTTEPCP